MTDDNNIQLSRRKVLAGLGTIGVASAGAGLGTTAWLSDEESFLNNVLTAGTLDLVVDYEYSVDQGSAGTDSGSGVNNGGEGEAAGGDAISFTIDDVKPGDSGNFEFCFSIYDNPAYLWACGVLTSNNENGYTEPEADVDDTPDVGELADAIQATAYYCDGDADETETPEEGDPGFIVAGTLAEVVTGLNYGLPLDGDPSTDAVDPFAPGDADNPCVCIDWSIDGPSVGNEIQGDSLSFDVTFHAVQSRHNDANANPCAPSDGECEPCSFTPGTPGEDASNLLSVGPDPSSGFPAIDARLRVDTSTGNAGDLTASNFAVCEDGCGQTIESVAFESGGLVDLVVVFDDTGSMGGEISALKAEVNDLTSDLEAAGVDARYALVSFKDIVELDTDFTDAATFQTAVSNLSSSGGGDTPEDNLDALAVGTGNAATDDGNSDTLSAFRSGAQRVIVDITDVGAHPETDSRTRFSQSQIEGFLDDGNFSFYAVAPSSVLSGSVSKRDIAENVDDGTWIDIASADFSTILNDITSAITEEAYVVSYTTSNPATDGSTRTVDIQVTDPDAGTMYEQGTYTAPSS